MPNLSIEKVGTQKAKLFLEKNKSNRPLNDRKVIEYAHEMKRGNWQINNDAICFDTKGKLLNGQHRLCAVIKSGITVDLLIARNMDADSFKVMDTQKSRTASDILCIEGIPNANKVAATAKFILNFERSAFSDASSSTRRKVGLTNSDISDFVNKNTEKIADALGYGHRKENRGLVPSATLCGLFYIFAKKDDDMADDFCDKLITGASISIDNPIYVVRQKLIADVRATKKMKPLHKIALICKAWNHYRNGKKLTQFGWDPIKEPFPKPI